jgi:glucose/arabinose dehydrogenase
MKKRILVILFFPLLFLFIYFKYLKPIYLGIKPAFLPSKIPIKNNKQEKTNFDLPLELPPNFSIYLFAQGLGRARDLELDPMKRLVVVSLDGNVFVLEDKNNDNIADENKILLSNLKNPHSVQFLCEQTCKLYLAEEDGVYIYDYDPEKIVATNPKKIINLPTGGRHITRTILIHNNKLFISVGSSCDVCEEKDWRRGKILVASLDGSVVEEYARGLRNSVFMTVHPVSGEIWATEMGRDWLGDNLPPDEINIIKKDNDYGWPICYGKNVHDSDFDKKVYVINPCQFKTPSYIDIPAHSAPLGLAFFQEEGWPEEYWYNLLVAYHGSWNRSIPTGYKVVRFKLNKNGKFVNEEDLLLEEGINKEALLNEFVNEEDFITGWLDKDRAWGRPVDILIQPGEIYISDDKAGFVYKMVYTGENSK